VPLPLSRAAADVSIDGTFFMSIESEPKPGIFVLVPLFFRRTGTQLARARKKSIDLRAVGPVLAFLQAGQHTRC
jgi:hypothetical protein